MMCVGFEPGSHSGRKVQTDSISCGCKKISKYTSSFKGQNGFYNSIIL